MQHLMEIYSQGIAEILAWSKGLRSTPEIKILHVISPKDK